MAAIPLLFVLVIAARTCAPLGSASQARAQLLEKFGPPEAFVPPIGGVVPAKRMATFIQIRGALQGTCEQFEVIQRSMQQVDDMGDGDEVTRGEIASTTGGLAKVAGRITPLIGEFFQARNEALLKFGMGLGEYIYIYTVAYREALLEGSGRDGIFTASGRVTPEVGDLVLSMLTKQSEQLGENDGTDRDRRMLQQEIRALQGDRTRVPFSESLPAGIHASLAPYREDLDSLYCPSITMIEMDLYPGSALMEAIY